MHLLALCLSTLCTKASLESWNEKEIFQSSWLDAETVCLKCKCSFLSACMVCVPLLYNDNDFVILHTEVTEKKKRKTTLLLVSKEKLLSRSELL